MTTVTSWLADLGLEKYAPDFEAAEIDFGTLPALREEDLVELGLPLGPRRKIWAAIQRLEVGAPASPEDAAPISGAPAAPAEGERRQLTIMFIDLVGSTALSARLDAEDMAASLKAYQNAVAGEITRMNGHVAKFMGDGVIWYFGWPQAHEDEAERAVRAALAITQAVARLDVGGQRLACRAGIATGRVVVGELVGHATAPARGGIFAGRHAGRAIEQAGSPVRQRGHAHHCRPDGARRQRAPWRPWPCARTAALENA